MRSVKKIFSLIVPVFGNEGSLPELLSQVADLDRRLGHQLEAIFVVDASPDRSYAILSERLATAPFASSLILLARNFGSFAAIRVGLEAARGNFFAVMAADLQEPIELTERFFRLLQKDECDITVGSRTKREDPLVSRWLSRLYWACYRKLLNPEIPIGGVDVFGCNLATREILLSMHESNSSLIGLLFWIGFRRRVVPYLRAERRHGRSGWSFRRKFRYLLDSVFAFTDLPINFLIAAGALGMAVSIALTIIICVMKLAGNIAVSGYAASAVITLFFAALNLFGIGVVGSYTWRAYENTKQRPSAIVMRRHQFKGVENETKVLRASKRAV